MTLIRSLSKYSAALWLAAGLCAAGAAGAQSTIVRVQTTQGTIDMQLLDAQAPLSVANFLTYVRAGDFADLFFTRLVKGFVLQGGGYSWPDGGVITAIPKRASVNNEFTIKGSNVRGTVALAKISGQPNSASSEWFVNLADNSGNLDTQNSGFTVFARVTTSGMAVVDTIAKLQTVDASALQAALTDLPVASLAAGANLQRGNVVRVSSYTELPPKAGVTDSERIFNYLESLYPQYLPPAGKQTGNGGGYIYRYYPGSNAYIGTKDNQVWYRVPDLGNNDTLLGTLTDWLANAAVNNF